MSSDELKCNDCVFYSESYHPRVDLQGVNCRCNKTATSWYRRDGKEVRDACENISQVNEHDMECLSIEENPDMHTKTTSWSYDNLQQMLSWMDTQEELCRMQEEEDDDGGMDAEMYNYIHGSGYDADGMCNENMED